MIVDAELVRPPMLLDKGLPIPGLTNRLVVDEGWVAVITEGGAYKERLLPGTHYLNRYSFFRDVKAVLVDTRVQSLNVATRREFSISQPVPVQIDIDLGVEYRVTDPRRVALEVKTPLTNLFDRVVEAVRSAVVHATVDDIRKQGEVIAAVTLNRLQAMQLPKLIGIEVFKVLVSSIKATDVGDDVLAAQSLKEFQTARDWQLDQAMLSQSKVTWEWLLVHRPEIAQQYLATYGEVARELIDKGLLDPAGFLNQPSTGAGQSGQMDPNNLLGSLSGFPGMPGLPGSTGSPGASGTPGSQPPGSSSLPQLPPQSGPSPAYPGRNIHVRMGEEINYLQKQPGYSVESDPELGSTAAPGTAYDLRVDLRRLSGGSIIIYFSCPSGYPAVPPIVDVVVDGQDQPFESAILRRWNDSHYLVEIAREVQSWFN
jgi:hypothetical protein